MIDDDEWVCRLLAVAMKEAGFEITICESAADGFYRAVEEQPDCIVCDVDLPDHNGYWVAKKIRSHPSRISAAPFVFLSGLDDREHRLEGFQVGADAYLTKPFRIDEVVAQVDALIQMAARLKRQRSHLASIPPSGAAMTGDLAQMSVATVLTLLDLERRSGRLELKAEGRTALLSVLTGNVVGAMLDGAPRPPLETIRDLMGWTKGKFFFHPSEESATSDLELTPINALLMEAARLQDEAHADESRPSSARLELAWKESALRTNRPANTPTPPPFAATPTPPPAAPPPVAPAPVRANTPAPMPAVRPATPLAQRSLTPSPMQAVRPTGAQAPKPGTQASTGTPTAIPPTVTTAAAPKPPLPAFKPKPSTSTLPAVTPGAGAPKPPKPMLPGAKTAFGTALRSLSPSKPITAVKPPPTKPEESLDAGWSSPPPSDDAEPISLEAPLSEDPSSEKK